MRKFLIKIISTFFYVGYFPFVPGTFASVTAVFLYYLIKKNTFIYVSFTLVLIILGFLLCGEAEEIFKRKDARVIVIDEVAGILLGLAFIPYSLQAVIIGFILFRILDALKPYPIGIMQRFKGSLGIMSDDLVAGVYTNIILQVVLRLASFKTS